MGAGDYSDSTGWGRGLTLSYSIGIPLGVVVGMGMLVFGGYICTRSGTKEIVETAANGGWRNQPRRLEIPLSNRAPAAAESASSSRDWADALKVGIQGLLVVFETQQGAMTANGTLGTYANATS